MSKADKPGDAARRLAKALSEARDDEVAREPLENAEGTEIGSEGLEEDPNWSHLDVRGKAPSPMETGSIAGP